LRPRRLPAEHLLAESGGTNICFLLSATTRELGITNLMTLPGLEMVIASKRDRIAVQEGKWMQSGRR
jgi:hypothetical protein